MLDVLKALVPAAKNLKGKARKRVAARTLVTIYSALNDCLSRGFMIVESLRETVASTSRERPNYPDNSAGTRDLEVLVKQQNADLADALDQLRQLSTLRILIDPVTYEMIRKLGTIKSNAVDVLDHMVYNGVYPVIAKDPGGQVSRLASLLRDEASLRPGAVLPTNDYVTIEIERRINRENAQEVLEICSALEGQLKSLGRLLKSFRGEILTSFTLDEVLAVALAKEYSPPTRRRW